METATIAGKLKSRKIVTNEDTSVKLDDFKSIIKGSLPHYKLDSVVCLYDGTVSVFYKNGQHHSIGNTIYSSNQINEFSSDFYQIESIAFISNFYSVFTFPNYFSSF